MRTVWPISSLSRRPLPRHITPPPPPLWGAPASQAQNTLVLVDFSTLTNRNISGPPPPPWCMGLLIRGLIGANPPTVKLVTSLGWMMTRDEKLYNILSTTHGAVTGQEKPEFTCKAANETLTLEPPAKTRCRVLQTNMPPFSTNFLQWRKAKPRNRWRISPSRPCRKNASRIWKKQSILKHKMTERKKQLTICLPSVARQSPWQCLWHGCCSAPSLMPQQSGCPSCGSLLDGERSEPCHACSAPGAWTGLKFAMVSHN